MTKELYYIDILVLLSKSEEPGVARGILKKPNFEKKILVLEKKIVFLIFGLKIKKEEATRSKSRTSNLA